MEYPPVQRHDGAELGGGLGLGGGGCEGEAVPLLRAEHAGIYGVMTLRAIGVGTMPMNRVAVPFSSEADTQI